MDPVHYDSHLFSELYDAHPQAIIWSPPIFGQDSKTIIDFAYTYCNEEALKYLRLSPEQYKAGLRLSSSPALTAEMKAQILQDMIQVYQSGEKLERSFYNAVLHKYVRVLRTKLRGGVLSIVQDRTEENRTIHLLEEQKSLLDNILLHSSNGITVGEMIRDGSGKITDIKTILANDAAVRFTGIPKEEYLAKTATEVDPAFTHSPYFQQCVRCMETGEPFITQYYLESIGRWLEVSVSKMDPERQIYIFTDVTPVKEAQLALEHSSQKLKTIINRTQSGILTAKPVRNEQGQIADFRFVLANKALAAYVHQEPEKLSGELGSRWFTGYMTNGLFDLFCDTYMNNQVNRFDYHYTADGIDAWIDMMCTRFDDEVLITFTDYTPVKQLQLQLEQKVEELKRTNQNLEAFAYAASHDLKEPMRKIRVFSDKLQQKLVQRGDKEDMFFIGRIENAAQRMDILIDDLLAYSHASQGSEMQEQVDLNERLRQVVEDLDVTIQEKKATIEIGLLPTVKGNSRQLQQLFQNLLSNALKYSKPDVSPLISVVSTVVHGEKTGVDLPPVVHNKQYHLIEVRDNGIGFEPEYTERIFQLFQRLHGRTEYAGTGIGLSIAQKVVENHHGYIWAESSPGEGATFKILLPLD
jgi:signal transduction histidine kinase